jgi:hypothetical protein
MSNVAQAKCLLPCYVYFPDATWRLHRIANGTVCKFRKLVLKIGKLGKIKMYDHWVHAAGMDDVEYIEVEWHDCDHFVGKFWLKPKVGIFRVKYPISEFGIKSRLQTNIELQYLPHKLQGKTVKSVVIAEWLKVKNWAYVVLSRVKTLCSLFLMSPIPEDINFGPAEDYLDMMQNLRRTILATPEQVSELKHNFSWEVKFC